MGSCGTLYKQLSLFEPPLDDGRGPVTSHILHQAGRQHAPTSMGSSASF